MSHIVTVQTQIRDAAAVVAACANLRWKPPLEGSHRLFSAQVNGLAVFAPNWRYPIVCELPTGRLIFDNFEGHWGDPKELDRFKQRYAVEKATIEARRLGRSVLEQQLADGSVKLTISVGAEA